jgi:hypothetical protein
MGKSLAFFLTTADGGGGPSSSSSSSSHAVLAPGGRSVLRTPMHEVVERLGFEYNLVPEDKFDPAAEVGLGVGVVSDFVGDFIVNYHPPIYLVCLHWSSPV